ncbi:hypothetical protein [Kineosporia succinea]|uniref:Protein-tyrosine phosphatase n=1 Tax=Kineosporia succinea TaxID=84632 RepID=A0ABT9NXE3_9ACTN|nr:hypothetical protein [Kineosporia succinea]MDP9825094.1 protein-tyrosine phosphatase [Kineosporia succinea]
MDTVQPRIKLDPTTSLGPVEKLREPLEDQLTSALRNAVDKVDKTESLEVVEEELLEATKAGLHPDIAEAIEPNPQQLRDVAARIVENG